MKEVLKNKSSKKGGGGSGHSLSAGESMWKGDMMAIQKCCRRGRFRESRAQIGLRTETEDQEVRGWSGPGGHTAFILKTCL